MYSIRGFFFLKKETPFPSPLGPQRGEGGWGRWVCQTPSPTPAPPILFFFSMKRSVELFFKFRIANFFEPKIDTQKVVPWAPLPPWGTAPGFKEALIQTFLLWKDIDHHLLGSELEVSGLTTKSLFQFVAHPSLHCASFLEGFFGFSVFRTRNFRANNTCVLSPQQLNATRGLGLK